MKTTTRGRTPILRHLRKAGVALLAVMAFEMPAFAADLTLVGDTDAEWNTKATNKPWTNSVGTAVAFADGDNVLISSEYFNGSSLTMNERVTPGNVEVYADRSFTLKIGSAGTYGLGVNTKSFTKRGSGTLLMDSVSSAASGPISNGNAMTCGVEIVEGEIACVRRNIHNYLGPRELPFWVYVRDGASLSFLEGNQTGTLSTDCGIKIQLDEGGRLNHCTNKVSESKMGGNNVLLCVNTLRLNGGDIENGEKAYCSDDKRLGSTNCFMKICKTLWFSGDTPHAFGFNDGDWPGCKTYTPDGTFKTYKMSLNSYSPVEFRVDDITGDDGVDAYANMLVFTYGTNTVGKYRSDIVKTGAGTLCFPSNNCYRPFKGDFTVKEGAVVFKSLSGTQLFFGAEYDDPLQTITISTGATMRAEFRNLVNTGKDMVPNVKFVIDHGTLEFVARPGSGTSDGKGPMVAREWVFDDATLVVTNQGLSEYAGIFNFRHSVTFRGTKPLVMWPAEGIDTSRQAVQVYNGYRTMNNGTEDGPVTMFDVADMTGDGRTDVVMGYHIWNGGTNNTEVGVLYDSGFIKTGPGTFSVASMTNRVSGVVTVSNGTLRVDGKLVTPSTVDVAAGAYIGGTGTVARVAMEAGSGFDAPAGQDRPLTVQGNLVLPATGVVNISNLDGSEEKDMPPVKLATATGNITGTENLADWTVKVNGVTTGKWRLEVKGGVLGARFDNGLVITFR